MEKTEAGGPPGEGKAADPRPADGKAPEGKAPEGKAPEGKAAESKAAGSASDGRPGDGKTAAGKPLDGRPDETFPHAARDRSQDEAAAAARFMAASVPPPISARHMALPAGGSSRFPAVVAPVSPHGTPPALPPGGIPGPGINPLSDEDFAVRAHARALQPLRLCRAEEVMSPKVVYIDGGASVAEAVRRMRSEQVSCLIIERRDDQDAWGIVTRADVIHKVVTPGRDPGEMRVYEIMSKPIITVSPGLLLKFCLRLMEQSNVRRAAVFDGHRLVGVLTHNDILAALKL